MWFTEQSFSFVQQFPAEPARKEEHWRRTVWLLSGMPPPGQNWRQGMPHHVIFKVHLSCSGASSDQRLLFLKQEAKENTECYLILTFALSYFSFYYIVYVFSVTELLCLKYIVRKCLFLYVMVFEACEDGLFMGVKALCMISTAQFFQEILRKWTPFEKTVFWAAVLFRACRGSCSRWGQIASHFLLVEVVVCQSSQSAC